MNKVKKAAAYVIGATVMAGVGAYMAMPKDAKQNLKGMIGSLMKKNSMDSKSTQE